MRLALFSDIHGHVTGLRAVLERIKYLGGADRICALGDFVGGGPGLDDVLDLLCEYDALMVRGNWDSWFHDFENKLAQVPIEGQANFLRTADWLFNRLSQEYQQLLTDLPLSITLELSENHRLLMCHATPADNDARVCGLDNPTQTLRNIYGNCDAEIIAYGHYHSQHMLQLDDKLLLNVASVGLGWHGLSALTMLEVHNERVQVQQYHVPYDVAEHDLLVKERNMPDNPAIWYW